MTDQILVCPLPIRWSEIYQTLFRAYETGRLIHRDITEPPRPLILNGWFFSNDVEKKLAWEETIQWAETNGFSQLIPAMASEEFYSVTVLRSQTGSPFQGSYHESWNYKPRTIPTPAEVENGFRLIMINWENLIGPDYSVISKPIGLTGKKKRRLLAIALQNTLPAWGYWNDLAPDQRRWHFTLLRKRVNEIIKPLEVDHIDFKLVSDLG
jgi:hypothetical protein